MNQFQVGDACLITHDVLIDRKTAFFKGNYISIASITPDPDKPGEYRYGVHSDLLGEDVHLSDVDVARRGNSDLRKEGNKPTVTPRVSGNQTEHKPSPNRRGMLASLHRILFTGGVLCLITGIVLTVILDKSGQSLAGGLIGLAIVAAVADVFVWSAHNKEVAKSETEAVKVKRGIGKYGVVLGILGVVVAVVATSTIIIWSRDKNNKTNAYDTKAKGLVEKRTRLIDEENSSATAFGEEAKTIAAYTDLTLLRTSYSGLADKYVPIFQGYYGQLKSIRDEFALMEPPSQFRNFHNLFLKSCDSFSNACSSSVDSFRLLKNIDESTESQMTSISAAIDRYSNEGEDLTNKAQQAWPE